MGQQLFQTSRSIVTALVVILTAATFMISEAKAQTLQQQLAAAYARFQSDLNAEGFPAAIHQIASENEAAAGGAGAVAAAIVATAERIVPDSGELQSMVGRGLAYYASTLLKDDRNADVEDIVEAIRNTGAAEEFARTAMNILGNKVLACAARPIFCVLPELYGEAVGASGSTVPLASSN
jgi:hypothetical protein